MNKLYRIRVPLALLGFLLLLISLYFCTKLRVDNSLDIWFNKGDPALMLYNDFCSDFGYDEVIVTMLAENEVVSSTRRLIELSALTGEINLLEGVSHAASLTNIPVIGEGPALRSLDYYLGKEPGQHLADSLFSIAKTYRSFQRFLGKDDKSTVIITWVEHYDEDEELRASLIHRLDSLANALSGSEIHHGGTGVIYDSLNKTTIKESVKFVSLSYLLVILLIVYFTRRWIWVLLTLLVVSSANIVLFGIMSLSNTPVNMVSMAIPPLIMVIGVAIIMHISRHLGNRSSDAWSFPSSPLIVLSLLSLPLIYNTVTSSGGFLSLAASSMAITRNYGLFAAAGVVLVFIFSLLFTLLFLKKLSAADRASNTSERFIRIAQGAFRFSSKNRRPVIISAILLVLVSVPGVLNLKIDTNTLGFLPDNHRVNIDNSEIEKQYGGYIPLDFLLSLPDDSEADLYFFESVLEWQNAVCRNDSIDASFSLADIVNDLGTSMGREAVGSFLPLLISQNSADPVKSRRLVSADKKNYRVSFFGPSCSAASLVRLADFIENKAAVYLDEGIDVTRSGYLPLYSGIISQVLSDQVKSFGIALLVILFLIALLLRSKRYTLVSIPSNLLPVLLVLAFMGYSKIPLDIGTITIAATILGIIVDDSIHILYHYKKYRRDVSLTEALDLTANTSGAAVIYSTIALGLGFLVLAFAGITTLSNSGILIAAAIFFALVTDLLLIPALLYYAGSDR